MRQIGGAPYVPGICPRHMLGTPIPNLAEADFYVDVYLNRNCVPPVISSYGVFSADDADTPSRSFVDTGVLQEPPDSPLGQRLMPYVGLGGNTYYTDVLPQGDPQAERIRRALCDRVANCRGVIEGTCWALGDAGFRETVAEVFQPDAEA